MDIVIRRTADQALRLAAEIIANTVRDKPDTVLGLATGRTMEPVYAHLVEAVRDGTLDLSQVTTFNLDEYVGLPPGDSGSFTGYMQAHLFEHVEVPAENIHIPVSAGSDANDVCAHYESDIEASGGIDLQVLGLGLTGHIGFNEPGSALRSRTRTKALSDITRRQNAAYFGGVENVPERAITMGIGTILDARRCLLVVTGHEKAQATAAALEGPITASVPASALQLHPNCVVILDQPASTKLANVGYYLTTFANEPEWEPYRKAGF